jgi:hypothetical protein
MSSIRRRRRSRARDAEKDVKDRLIQTRVPEKLESALKEEAKKRRLTVSHLIRNMLEDTLDLVDTVATGLDDIARSSAGLAEQVARDAGKIAAVARDSFKRPNDEPSTGPERGADSNASPDAGDASRREAPRAPSPAPRVSSPAALDSVLAWNPVVVNRPATCASCDRELDRGSNAFLGIQVDPTAPPAWLCAPCMGSIQK